MPVAMCVSSVSCVGSRFEDERAFHMEAERAFHMEGRDDYIICLWQCV